MAIFEKGEDMARKSAPISLLGQQSGLSILDSFRHSPRAKTGHGKSHRLGLYKDHSQSLGIAGLRTNARHGENASSIHPLAHNSGGLHSQEGVVPQAPAGHVLQFLAKLSIADHHELGFRRHRLDLMHRLDKMRASLFLREPAGKQNHRLSRPVPVGLKKLRVYSDVVHYDALFGKSPGDHLLSQKLRDREVERGLLVQEVALADIRSEERRVGKEGRWRGGREDEK